MIKRITAKLILLVMMTSLFLVSSCGDIHHASIDVEESSVADKLIVYLSAAPHGIITIDKEQRENIEIYYPSKYVVGMHMVEGEVECVDGNIFEQALVEYSEKTGIEIEIHYLEEYEGDKDVLQELYENDSLPDLLILNKHSQYDYYRLEEQGILLDFSQYLEDDLKDEEQYYKEVLDGGIINHKQVVLPILFNLNGMITSTSYLNEIGVNEFAEEYSFEDILFLLEESCVQMQTERNQEAIFEASGLMYAGRYIPSILSGAAYPKYFDDELINIEISKEAICDILQLMELYNRQEFNVDAEWESKTYIENVNNQEIKSRKLISLEEEYSNYVGIFLSGGKSGGINLHNSLLTDAMFFNTIYKNMNNEMVFYGIPTVDDYTSYSANISVMAASFSTTEYPEDVYNLIRYLMDYSYPMAYGFSVNQQITDLQLVECQKTVMNIYSDSSWSSVTAGVKSKEEIKNESIVLEPLNQEIVEKIQYMLDNIAGAGLPFATLESHIYETALQMVNDKEMTCDEASDWIIHKLNEDLKNKESVNPFYDLEYIRLINEK